MILADPLYSFLHFFPFSVTFVITEGGDMGLFFCRGKHPSFPPPCNTEICGFHFTSLEFSLHVPLRPVFCLFVFSIKSSFCRAGQPCITEIPWVRISDGEGGRLSIYLPSLRFTQAMCVSVLSLLVCFPTKRMQQHESSWVLLLNEIQVAHTPLLRLLYPLHRGDVHFPLIER
jgi:hypothetical protein